MYEKVVEWLEKVFPCFPSLDLTWPDPSRPDETSWATNIQHFVFLFQGTNWGSWDRHTHHRTRQTYQPTDCIYKTLAPSKLPLGHTAGNPCRVPKMVANVCTLGWLAGTGGGSCETGRCRLLYLPTVVKILHSKMLGTVRYLANRAWLKYTQTLTLNSTIIQTNIIVIIICIQYLPVLNILSQTC